MKLITYILSVIFSFSKQRANVADECQQECNQFIKLPSGASGRVDSRQFNNGQSYGQATSWS